MAHDVDDLDCRPHRTAERIEKDQQECGRVHQEDADNVDGPVGCAEAQLS